MTISIRVIRKIVICEVSVIATRSRIRIRRIRIGVSRGVIPVIIPVSIDCIVEGGRFGGATI